MITQYKMVPPLWERQLPRSSRERHSTHARTHVHSHLAHSPSWNQCKIRCRPLSLHHRDTLGKWGRGGGHGTSNLGHNTPSTNTQVPEIKRKSEEKGWETIRGVKKLLRKKHTTEERGHMILISNPWLLSRFFSGASDTPGTQESESFSQRHLLRRGLMSLKLPAIPTVSVWLVVEAF